MSFDPQHALKFVPFHLIPWAKEQYAKLAGPLEEAAAKAGAEIDGKAAAQNNKLRLEWWDKNWDSLKHKKGKDSEGDALREKWAKMRLAVEKEIRKERAEYRKRRDSRVERSKEAKKEAYADVVARWEFERPGLYMQANKEKAELHRKLRAELETKQRAIIAGIKKEAVEMHRAEQKAAGQHTLGGARKGLPVPKEEQAEEQPTLPTAKNKAIRNSFAKAVLAAGKPAEESAKQVNPDQTVGKPNG